MPFIMIDDFDTSGNGSDELFADVTPDQLAQIILTGVAGEVGGMVMGKIHCGWPSVEFIVPEGRPTRTRVPLPLCRP